MSLRVASRRISALARPSCRAISTFAISRPLASTSKLAAAPYVQLPRRWASSTPHGDPGVDPSISIRDLTDAEYHDLADTDMDILHEGLEILCEEYGPNDWEVEYSSGVMTLTVPPHGTYVINKQPPNHQIWVSSPVSGPSRFSRGADDIWVHHRRKGVQLGALLEGELRKFLEELGQGGEEGWEGVGLK